MKDNEPSTIALYSDEPPTETPTWNDVRIHKLEQSTHPCHIVVGDREVWLRDSQAVHKLIKALCLAYADERHESLVVMTEWELSELRRERDVRKEECKRLATKHDPTSAYVRNFPSGPYARWTWSLHNIVGHPLSEVLHLLGMHRASVWVHDFTLPRLSRAERKQ